MKDSELGDTVSSQMDEEPNMIEAKEPFCRKYRLQINLCGALFLLVTFLCVGIPILITKIIVKSDSQRSGSYDVNSIIYGDVWMPLSDKLFAEIGSQEWGESVDLSGDGSHLAIGSNAINGFQGQVEVRRYTGRVWRQAGNTVKGKFQGENFGHVVQISRDGMILVAGGTGSDKFPGKNKGSVRSYSFDDSAQEWNQFGDDVEGDYGGDRFATSLSLSADGLSWIAGADNYHVNDIRNGYAKVYELKDGDWRQKGQTIQGMDGSRTGYATAMSGDGNTICVGDRWYRSLDGVKTGRVRCFGWSGNAWTRRGNDIVGNIKNGQMGYSLSLNYDGNRVVAGDRNGGDNYQGSVTTFQLNGNSWNVMGEPQVSAGVADQGGFQVELNAGGNVLAWTARGHDTLGQNETGIVRVIRWVNDEWIALGDDIIGDKGSDYFGESVALSDDGTILACSSNWNDVEYVRAFALTG